MSFDYANFADAFPWFFPFWVTLFGAMVGSFLNVVIYRLPAGQSVVTPGSHCACGQPIRWYDNIPVLSWFLLRGKARCCGRPYSFRYAFVEILTSALFLAAWLQHPPLKALAGMVLLGLLIAAFFIDLDHFIIPDEITIGGTVVGVLIAWAVPALHGFGDEPWVLGMIHAMGQAILGVLVGSGLVLWFALIAEKLLRKEAMGFGDVKFVGLIGAFCGWPGAVFSLFGGAMVGTVWFAVILIWQKITGRTAPIAPPAETADGKPTAIAFGAQVPFGPMLAIAAAAYFLGLDRYLLAYLHEVAPLFSQH